MAQAILASNSIVIRYYAGLNADGRRIYRNQKFLSVRQDVSDDDFYAIGDAIMSLMGTKDAQIMKVVEYEMVSN